VEELCRKIDDWRITFEERHPAADLGPAQARRFRLIIPKAYGGKGSATANSEIVLKIAPRGPSAAVAVIVPNSLGPGELLMLFGTEEQKRYCCRAGRRTGDPGLRAHQPDAGSMPRR
jgi:acyl-CoA dehydrogenase